MNANKDKSVVKFTFGTITRQNTCFDVKTIQKFNVAAKALSKVKVYEFDGKSNYLRLAFIQDKNFDSFPGLYTIEYYSPSKAGTCAA